MFRAISVGYRVLAVLLVLSIANDAYDKAEMILGHGGGVLAALSRMTGAPDLVAYLYFGGALLLMPLLATMAGQLIDSDIGWRGSIRRAANTYWRDAMHLAAFGIFFITLTHVLMVFVARNVDVPAIHSLFLRESVRNFMAAGCFAWFLSSTAGTTLAVQHLRRIWPVVGWCMLVVPSAHAAGRTLAEGIGDVDPVSIGVAAGAGLVGGALRSLLIWSSDHRPTGPHASPKRVLIDLCLSMGMGVVGFFVAEALIEAGLASSLRQWPLAYGLILVAIGSAPTWAAGIFGRMRTAIGERAVALVSGGQDSNNKGAQP